LNLPLTTVLHRASPTALQAANEQKAAASAAPAIKQSDLTAPEWFEPRFLSTDPSEEGWWSEEIRLKPDNSSAFHNRGIVRESKNDLEGAIQDFNEAIRLSPDYALTYKVRARVLEDKREYASAIADYQKYLDLGGGVQNNNESFIEWTIRNLKNKLDLGGGVQNNDESFIEWTIRNLKNKL
jgi:tetratricopeptide (TPR) repeat protein